MKNSEIKKILVPYDFSETADIALTEACVLARMLKAEIFILHVLEPVNIKLFTPKESMEMLPSNIDMQDAVQKKMSLKLAEIQKTYGIQTSLKISSGHIHTEILNLSESENINLIIMGTHGARGYKEMFIGSNTQRVVSLSDVPVLTFLNKLKNSAFQNILIPIDNSILSREKVNIAITFAKMFGSEIHILGLPDSWKTEDLNKFQMKIDSVEELISSENLKYHSSIVKEKDLSSAAINYSDKHKCDLIVINTGHESEISGIFLGLFAQQIVNHSTVPVLSFKHSESHYVIETPGYGIS